MTPGHKPLEDSAVRKRMFELLAHTTESDVADNSWKTENYTDAVISWMQDHPLNNLQGLDQFPHRAYSAGSVDAIISFVHRHGAKRRLRFSQAEFVAAKIASQSADFEWSFLEHGPIEHNDAVMISAPFSGSGNMHTDFEAMLDCCDSMDVPVFLDLSYWPISHSVALDLSRQCVKEVAFSLSKPLATQLRLGLRLTRTHVDDMLQVNSDLKIYNRVAVSVGMQLMKEFSIDWLLSKYLYRQVEVCNTLGIEPTNTFTLARGDADLHREYNRNGYNRICITDEITDF
jgi:hypothetical protein